MLCIKNIRYEITSQTCPAAAIPPPAAPEIAAPPCDESAVETAIPEAAACYPKKEF
jgi:hypothetical protein